MASLRMYLRICLIGSITWSSMPHAFSQEIVKLPGFATFIYEGTFKLNKKGCQRIPIRYETEDSLPRENTGMAVLIDNKKPKDGIGYAMTGWFSNLTYQGAPEMAFVWPRAGQLELKVCRNNWTNGTAESKSKFLKVKPGKYEITFNGFYIDELIGKPRNEVVTKSYIFFK